MTSSAREHNDDVIGLPGENESPGNESTKEPKQANHNLLSSTAQSLQLGQMSSTRSDTHRAEVADLISFDRRRCRMRLDRHPMSKVSKVRKEMPNEPRMNG